MSPSKKCPICSSSGKFLYEIPKVSTQYSEYTFGKAGQHYWICGQCLNNVFNQIFLKGKSKVQDSDLTFEWMANDLSISSCIYSAVNEVIENKKGSMEPVDGKVLDINPNISRSKEPDADVGHFKTQIPKTEAKRMSLKSQNSDLIKRILTPKEIEFLMKQNIVGQDRMVRDLSLATFKYLTSLANPNVKRSTVLILGQSGTGKTESVKTLAKITERPMLSINSAMLTPTGYRGENINTIAEKLISLFGDKAKNAILYFDEFDKLVDPDGANEASDFKKMVLPELYKIMDGDPMVATSHRGETISLETKGMFIIMTGAFQKMEDGANRLMNVKKMGLDKSSEQKEKKGFSFSDVTKNDLIEYGFPVELIGRISIVTNTLKFDSAGYLDILRNSSSSILVEYTHLFNSLRSEVVFTDAFLLSVVDRSLKERTGARTMSAIIEERMLSELYHIDYMIGKRVIIDVDGTRVLDLEEEMSINN